jgi:C4-dicarboxylate transporter DctQ subunit
VKIAKKAGNIFNKVITASAVLAAVLIIMDALITSAGSLARSFLGISYTGIFEITQYSLLWMTFLAAAWLLKNKGHIRVDLVYNRLEPRPRALTRIVTSIIYTILFLVLVGYSIKVTLHDCQTGNLVSSALRPPKWIIEIIIPTGFFMLFIQMLRETYGFLTNRKVVSEGKPTQSDSTTGGKR